jgi:hypothetical protein
LSTEYIVRHYKHGDEKGILELLDHAFNGWPKLNVDPLSYWRWKYVDSPYWKNDIAVALHGDQIIGCKHSVYLKLKVGESILDCTLGSDMAVHQDYRSRGVSNELSSQSSGKKMKIGYDISYFVTSNPMLIKKYWGQRVTLPQEVAVYVLIKDVDKQINNMPMKRPLLKKIGYKGVTVVNRISRRLGNEKQPYVGVVRKVKGFDERIEGLWEKTAPHYDFIVRRDAQYLNWRCADPRAGQHEIWLAEEDDQVLGFCVVYINRYREKYPVAYVMDLICFPDRGDVVSALLGEVVKFFDDSDCNLITSLAVEGSPLEDALSMVGFLNSREKLNIFMGRHGLRAGDEAVKKTIENCTPDSLHFCYGDIDSLPVNLPETPH